MKPLLLLAILCATSGCVSTQFAPPNPGGCAAFAGRPGRILTADGLTTTVLRLDATNGSVVEERRPVDANGNDYGLHRSNQSNGMTPKPAEKFGLPSGALPGRWLNAPLASVGGAEAVLAITEFADRHGVATQRVVLVEPNDGRLIAELGARSRIRTLDWSSDGRYLMVVSTVEPEDPPGWWTKLDRLAPHGVPVDDIWARVFRRDGALECELRLGTNVKWANPYLIWRDEKANAEAISR